MEEVAPVVENPEKVEVASVVYATAPDWNDLAALIARDNDNNSEAVEFVTFKLNDGSEFQFPENIAATLKTAKNLMDECSREHGLIVPLSELKNEGYYQYKYVPLAFSLLYVNSRDPVPQYIPIDETKKYPLETEIYKYSAYDLMAAVHIIHYLEPEQIFMTAVIRYMTNKDIRGKSVEDLCKNYGVDPATIPDEPEEVEETKPVEDTPVAVSGDAAKDKSEYNAKEDVEDATNIEEVD